MSATMPPSEMHLDLSRIAQDLQIRKVQVESVVLLLDEGNTVPFITRYRKERTGGLDEEVIRTIQARITAQRRLSDRKLSILKSIEGKGKLTEDLRLAILAADTNKRLDDLYLPFKGGRETLANKAIERGLEPLAIAVLLGDPAVPNLNEFVATLINPEKELNTPEDVLLGVQHIIADQISKTAEVRAIVRAFLWDTAKVGTIKSEKLAENQGQAFKNYFQFSESARTIPPHRILAVNRGEKENVLGVRLEYDLDIAQRLALENLPLTAFQPPPAEGQSSEPPRRIHLPDHPHAEFLRKATADALTRLVLPSLEREIRRELTGVAEEYAVGVFARNLRSLLMQPPLHGKRVLAVDPGFRTGCKVACLDETGNLLEETIIYPHPPQNRKEEAKFKLADLVDRYKAHVVAIGNGTACRETEELVSELIAALAAGMTLMPPAPPAPPPPPIAPPVVIPPAAETPPPLPTPPSGDAAPVPEAAAPVPEAPPAQIEPLEAIEPSQATPPPLPPIPEPPPPPPPAPPPVPAGPPRTVQADLAYVIVNEAGASVYSASNVGREEFPNLDASSRGTISIGRRLQDPLSELVKIDPQNIGVGLYQHDVKPSQLKDTLEAVVESCVNNVGVDLNTASVPLLRHVSGLNQVVARDLVAFRQQNGIFRSREQLLQVPGIGQNRYVQAAGFLKIGGGDDPLDQTWIHPESYPIARQILTELGFAPDSLNDRQKTEELRERLRGVSTEEVATRLSTGGPTVHDILDALARPGRDPREDLPPPIFKKGVLKLEDLTTGMELKGTVLNVVPFGAFVDIGLKESGLVHISQMANRYVKSPEDVVAVNDVVVVWVLKVDQDQRHVSLTMIKPGTERRGPDQGRGGRPEQQGGEGRPMDRGGRPPRERRPEPAGARSGGGPGPGPGPGQGGFRRQGGGRPGGPGGNRGGPPPRRHGGPPSQSGSSQEGGGAPAQSPPPPRRKPPRPQPKANITQAQALGSAPLHSFG